MVIALLCGGCLDNLGPDTGPPLRAACVDEDSDPATPVLFAADVKPAFVACTRCHTPGGATPIGLQIGGLDLSSYASLRAGGVQSAAEIVVAGEPCSSVLIQKLGAGPPFGSRMPLDGPPYLDARTMLLVADWIAEGAHE